MAKKPILIYNDKSYSVVGTTEDNIEINEKTIEIGKTEDNKNRKPKTITYTVTRKFSGIESYEELLKQVIKDHS